MSAFPANVVTVLKAGLASAPIGPSVTPSAVLGRGLRSNDPTRAIGIMAGDWAPIESEIGNPEPSIARYNFNIQYMIKHVNEEDGRAEHSAGSKTIRTMLYRTEPLGVALRGLSETDFGVRESVARFGVSRQQFRSNEVRGQFMFVSNLGLWVEVNT